MGIHVKKVSYGLLRGTVAPLVHGLGANVRRPSGGRAWEAPPPRATTGGPPAFLIQQLPSDQFLDGLVSGAQPEAWARPVDPPGSLFGHLRPPCP